MIAGYAYANNVSANTRALVQISQTVQWLWARLSESDMPSMMAQFRKAAGKFAPVVCMPGPVLLLTALQLEDEACMSQAIRITHGFVCIIEGAFLRLQHTKFAFEKSRQTAMKTTEEFLELLKRAYKVMDPEEIKEFLAQLNNRLFRARIVGARIEMQHFSMSKTWSPNMHRMFESLIFHLADVRYKLSYKTHMAEKEAWHNRSDEIYDELDVLHMAADGKYAKKLWA